MAAAHKTILFRFFDASIGKVGGNKVLVDKFDNKTLVDNIGNSFNVELPTHDLKNITQLNMRQCRFNIDTLTHTQTLNSEITTYLLELESKNKFKGFFTCSNTGWNSLCYPFVKENQHLLQLFAQHSKYVFFTIIDNLAIKQYEGNTGSDKLIEEHNFDGLLNSDEFRSKLSIPSGHDVQKEDINTIQTSGYCVNGVTVTVSERDEKTYGHLEQDVKATCKIDITGSIDKTKINVLALGKLMPEPNLHEINFTGNFGINGYLVNLQQMGDTTDYKVYGANMILYSILSGLLVENGEQHTISKINNGELPIQLSDSLTYDLKRVILRRYNFDGEKIIKTLNDYNIDTTEINAYYTTLQMNAAEASAAKREQLRQEDAARAEKKAANEERRKLYEESVSKAKTTKEKTHQEYFNLLNTIQAKLDKAFPSGLTTNTTIPKQIKDTARTLSQKLRKFYMTFKETNFKFTNPIQLRTQSASQAKIKKLIEEFKQISDAIDENLKDYYANGSTPRATPMATSRATPMATSRATPMATPRATPMATPRATPMATNSVTASMLSATPRATPMATNTNKSRKTKQSQNMTSTPPKKTMKK